MANNVKVVLNTEGVRELLRSDEMKSICEEHAIKIQNRCGDGYETDTYRGRNRVNAMVKAVTYQARADNMENNTILKAVEG